MHPFAPPAARSVARRPAAPRRIPLALWLLPAAALITLVGCSTGELRDGFGELTTGLRVCCAAEKAYLHRGDLFHDCCSCPLDFKHGFKNGYRDVAMNGEDCCAPPTPPACYWGCSTSDPCERVERLNCYYDGWTHGAIAAGQDGVVALNTVPLRNICGGYDASAAGFGPTPGGPPSSYGAPGPGMSADGVPPAPLPDLAGPNVAEPERIDAPRDGGPTPAPLPLLSPDSEGSVGEPSENDLLQRLLDADTYDPIPAPAPPAMPEDAMPDSVRPDGDDAPADMPTLDDPFGETPAEAVPFDEAPPGDDLDGPVTRAAPPAAGAGPRVTALWGGTE